MGRPRSTYNVAIHKVETVKHQGALRTRVYYDGGSALVMRNGAAGAQARSLMAKGIKVNVVMNGHGSIIAIFAHGEA